MWDWGKPRQNRTCTAWGALHERHSFNSGCEKRALNNRQSRGSVEYKMDSVVRTSPVGFGRVPEPFDAFAVPFLDASM